MAFNLPTLHNFLTSDNDYVNNINDNFDQIYSSFSGALADINNVLSLTGTSVAADFYKRRTGDPLGVILGPYAYVLRYSGSTLSLKSDALDDTSAAYISGVRKTTIGDGLAFDVSTITPWVENDSKALSVGLNLVSGSDTEVEMVAAVTGSSGAPLLTLYTVEIQLKSGAYTLNRDKTRREPGTMAWDNTLEQTRQESVKILRLSTSYNTALGASIHGNQVIPFKIPYNHTFVSCDCYVNGTFVNNDTSSTVSVSVRDTAVDTSGAITDFNPVIFGNATTPSPGDLSITHTGTQPNRYISIGSLIPHYADKIIKGGSSIYYAKANDTGVDGISNVTFEIGIIEHYGMDDSVIVT